MAKISEMNVLTEKGVLKNNVRASIKGHDSGKVADTLETLGFEDYPCEMTMLRWKNKMSEEYLVSLST